MITLPNFALNLQTLAPGVTCRPDRLGSRLFRAAGKSIPISLSSAAAAFGLPNWALASSPLFAPACLSASSEIYLQLKSNWHLLQASGGKTTTTCGRRQPAARPKVKTKISPSFLCAPAERSFACRQQVAERKKNSFSLFLFLFCRQKFSFKIRFADLDLESGRETQHS